MGNVYIGKVTASRHYKVTKNGRNLSPKRSQRVWNHSPDGFCWGYGGSGPAQLALALLLSEGLPRWQALQYYQEFKRGVIARLPAEPGDQWRLSGQSIMEWLADNTDCDLFDLRKLPVS